jgi:hypothetical protein
LRELAGRAANEALQRPRVQAAWEEANRRAHKLLLAVVEGKSVTVSTEGGVVTLDLRALVRMLGSQVGIDVSDKLPEDVGEIEVLQSDELSLAQDLVRLLKGLAIGLTAAALALYALAIYLARGWRREALRASGFGFIAVGIAVLVARSLAGNAVVGSLATTESVEPAAESAWSIATSLLAESGVAMIGYGVAIVLGAWLAGSTALARWLRRMLTPVLRERRIGYAVLAVIVLLVFWWNPTEATQRLIPSLLLILLLIAGFEALRAQAIRDFPDETRGRAAERWRAWVDTARSRRVRARAGGRAADDERISQLERLARLRESGLLDDEELRREKQRILA